MLFVKVHLGGALIGDDVNLPRRRADTYSNKVHASRNKHTLQEGNKVLLRTAVPHITHYTHTTLTTSTLTPSLHKHALPC